MPRWLKSIIQTLFRRLPPPSEVWQLIYSGVHPIESFKASLVHLKWLNDPWRSRTFKKEVLTENTCRRPGSEPRISWLKYFLRLVEYNSLEILEYFRRESFAAWINKPLSCRVVLAVSSPQKAGFLVHKWPRTLAEARADIDSSRVYLSNHQVPTRYCLSIFLPSREAVQ